MDDVSHPPAAGQPDRPEASCQYPEAALRNRSATCAGFLPSSELLPEWIDKTGRSADGEERRDRVALPAHFQAGFTVSVQQLAAIAASRCDGKCYFTEGANTMSKSQDSKKATKKEPTKTLKEKREAKKTKQEEKKRQ
jgi:hypothetical protein